MRWTSARWTVSVATLGAAVAAGFWFAGLAAGDSGAPGVGVPGQVTFDRIVVDQGRCAQTIRVNGIADVDGDGKPDILAAGDSGVFWFGNRSLACHTVARGRYGTGSTIFGYDVNHDGRTDIVTGLEAQRKMVWFQNTGHGWPEHLLTASAYCHNVTFADVNGDGRDDIGCVDATYNQTVSWLEAPADPSAPWTDHVIDRNRPAWGDQFADIDGDGRVDLVAGRAWYRNTGTDHWTRYPYTDLVDTARSKDIWFGSHFSDYDYLHVLDVNGDGRLDVVAVLFSGTPEGQLWAFLAPAHPTTQPWTAVQIDAGPLFSVHSLDVGDFDGSGRVQVMVAEMEIGGYGFGSAPDPRLRIYRLDGDPAKPSGWTRLVIDHFGTHEATTVDFDGDGRPDIVGGDENSELARPPRPGHLVIWRNTTPLRGGAATRTRTTTTTSPPTRTSADQGPNLAPDPGFEADPAGAYVSHGPAAFAWGSHQSHGGRRSLRIAAATSQLARWLSRTRTIPVTAGASYRVSVYARTDGVANGAGLSVNFWGAGGQYIPATVGSPSTLHGSEGWTKLSLDATAPAGAAYLRVEFRLNGPGRAWFDDLSVTAG